MKIDRSGRICRHLAAPGSATEHASQFGTFLKAAGIRVPEALSLREMTERGWIVPTLRVALPPAALNSWRNFPSFSMQIEGCPVDDEWALNLWAAGHTMPHPRVGPSETWSRSYLEDENDPTTVAALRAAVAVEAGAESPRAIVHEASGQEAPSYIDYFAYWQALQVAELIDLAAVTYYAVRPIAMSEELARQQADWTHQSALAARKRWDARRQVFDWLSRFRTLLASWAASGESWDIATSAVRSMAEQFNITADTVRGGIRDTLLVLWNDWTHNLERRHPSFRAALRLLQDDIAVAVRLLEILSGEAVDPTEEPWKATDRQAREWSDLVDALPREDWLARTEFPHRAALYLRGLEGNLCPPLPLRRAEIEALTKKSWRGSRPFRRFCLAFDRLHRELDMERKSAAFDWREPIRQRERIEQLLLLPLHAERLLSAVHRQQPGARKYPDVRPVTRSRLERALLAAGVDSVNRAAAVARLNELVSERAQLHEKDFDGGDLFCHAEEVGLGTATLNILVAAHANFIIARNYAAHHDAADGDLIYPTEGEAARHPGHVAITSALIVVLCALLDL